MVNKLEHLNEFQEILTDYRISETGRDIIRSTKLVLLIGPTSAGRNTIINALLKSGAYHLIVSDTTRSPRVNDGVLEKNGKEYWFREEIAVLDDLKKGLFLEAALIHNQQVSGISLREIKRAKRQDKIAVNEIEVVGMQNIIEAKPDTYAFFVAPPSFEIWMNRMEKRGSMVREEKLRRLRSAVKEYETALVSDFYAFIINDEFANSVEWIHQYVIEGVRDVEYQEHARAVIEKILLKTRRFLEKNK